MSHDQSPAQPAPSITPRTIIVKDDETGRITITRPPFTLEGEALPPATPHPFPARRSPLAAPNRPELQPTRSEG